MRITIDIDGDEVGVDTATATTRASITPSGASSVAIEIFDGGAAPVGAMGAGSVGPVTSAGLPRNDSATAINAGAAPAL